ncbi:MAG TPA: fumarylacetoacetate hydrolase family protein [Rudaea sp.]|jgi:fumarylpyruvate hydrolase|nr:fumarylacetoacetate hydrolase family protein [Rudaea sp.]
MYHVFDPPIQASAAITGSTKRFPVRRIFCIGRNYAEHAAEMGASVDRGNPVFFCKPADAIVADGADIPYPQATQELHHEVEMVVALHSGGTDIAEAGALRHVFGYAVGLDLTRRDLQTAAKAKGMPWDSAKAFDHSAPLSAIRAATEIGHPHSAALTLEVNGEVRQRADIAQMIFAVPEILARLSRLFELKAGDLVFTGTPAGVGPLARGDVVHARLAGVAELRGRIV